MGKIGTGNWLVWNMETDEWVEENTGPWSNPKTKAKEILRLSGLASGRVLWAEWMEGSSGKGWGVSQFITREQKVN